MPSRDIAERAVRFTQYGVVAFAQRVPEIERRVTRAVDGALGRRGLGDPSVRGRRFVARLSGPHPKRWHSQDQEALVTHLSTERLDSLVIAWTPRFLENY